MTRLLVRSQDESGQVLVLVAFFLVFMVGLGALVIDAGSWYRADRAAQTAADAAALAGAQDLPSKSDAVDSANDYWGYNPDSSNAVSTDGLGVCIGGEPPDTDGDGDGDALNASLDCGSDYEISTEVKRNAHGFFAKAFDILGVTVEADASAQVLVPLKLKNVAPVVVRDTEVWGFGVERTVSFGESDATSSAIGLIDFDCRSTSPPPTGCDPGGIGSSVLEGWIRDDGYDSDLPTNMWYEGAGGERIGPIRDAMEYAAKKETPLLIPVFDDVYVYDKGKKASFHVIGWAAFDIKDFDGVDWTPGKKELTGKFVTFIATDLGSEGTQPNPDNDFGVHMITLTR